MKAGSNSQSVLYVVYSSLASPTGGGRTRVIDSAKQAQMHGYFVRILCFVRPEQWFKPVFLRLGKRKLKSESNCPAHYFPRLPFTRFPWVHWLNDQYCGWVIRLFISRFKIRVVHGHGFQPSWLALLARSNNPSVSVVADIHGASLAEALYSGSLIIDDPLVEIYQKREKQTLNQADWLIFVSNVMMEYFKTTYSIQIRNYSIIPSAINFSSEWNPSIRKALRNQNNLEDKIVFVYAGSAAPYQLISEMCTLFTSCLKVFPNAYFLILSHHQDEFRKQLDKTGLTNKSYRIQGVEHKEVIQYLQMCDIGFLLRDDDVVNRVASPTKFGEYCVSGLPMIITASVGDFSQVVKQHKIGFGIDLNHLEVDADLTEFIHDVVHHREDYARRTRKYAKEHLSWLKFGEELVRVYDRADSSQ